MTQFIILALLYNVLVGRVESEYNIEEDEKKKIKLRSSGDL